jgi:hypothetical protein
MTGGGKGRLCVAAAATATASHMAMVTRTVAKSGAAVAAAATVAMVAETKTETVGASNNQQGDSIHGSGNLGSTVAATTVAVALADNGWQRQLLQWRQ